MTPALPVSFRVLHRLNVILSLRRIRDPSARRDEVRILRLRSQARFAQDDTALRDRSRPGPGLACVAKREDSYGPKSGPNAGSRASSPGEQAAACDCQRTRALGRGASRSLRLQKNSCAGPGTQLKPAACDCQRKLVRWVTCATGQKTRALGDTRDCRYLCSSTELGV